MSDLVREMLADRADMQGVRFTYGTTTAENTVPIDGAATATPCQAIGGPYPAGVDVTVAVQDNADPIIIGLRNDAWVTTWTPTWGNLTVGNGTETWRWRYETGGARVYGTLEWGSTSTLDGGVVSVSLPVSAALTSIPVGTAHYNDASSTGSDLAGVAWTVGAASCRVTWGTGGNWSSSIPATGPDTGDVFAFNLFIPT